MPRYSGPCRIRIHGPQEAGAAYIGLARTLLGDQMGIHVDAYDSSRGLASQSHVSKTYTPKPTDFIKRSINLSNGVRITVQYNNFMPVVDIWTEDDEVLRGIPQLRFGVAGRRRLDGETGTAFVASFDYNVAYTGSLPAGRYIGHYRSLFCAGTDLLSQHQNINVRYPIPRTGAPFNAPGDTRLNMMWQYRPNAGGCALGTPYRRTPEIQGLVNYHMSKQGTVFREHINTAPLRTEENGDKIVVYSSLFRQIGTNVDPGGVSQPYPVYRLYNTTRKTFLSEGVFPTRGLLSNPVPGLLYLSPKSIAVGDTSFYSVVFSYPGYAVNEKAAAAEGIVPISLDVAQSELSLFFTNDDGQTFLRRDIKPILGDEWFGPGFHQGANAEMYQYHAPEDRWRGMSLCSNLSTNIYRMQITMRLLAIGGNEILIALTAIRGLTNLMPTEPHHNHHLDDVSCIVLRCSPSSITKIYAHTEKHIWPNGWPGTELIEAWVYLGNGVVLAKFCNHYTGVDRPIEYRRSFDYGATWESLDADGLPGNRLNQFYGEFRLVEPYEVDEDGNVVGMGVVLTSVYHDSAYRSYVSTNVGATWTEAGKLSDTDEFFRVDMFYPGEPGTNSFNRIQYTGDSEDPAPFDPALPELMQRPQP